MKMRVLAAILAFASSISLADSPKEATLEIKGMDCGACPLTVKVVLKKVQGVEEVVVDKSSAKVRFDSSRVQPEQLAKAVTEAGFPARVRQ